MPGRAGRNRNRNRNRNANSQPSQPSQSKEPFSYWNDVAATKIEARNLAAEIGLDFPDDGHHGVKAGLVYPLRRLIVTGTDTPENLSLLLGPLWEQQNELIKETRVEVLLSPPSALAPGSPMGMMNQALDIGCPRWSPRAPNTEEAAEMARYREMMPMLQGLLAEARNGP